MGERTFRENTAEAGSSDVRRIDFPHNSFNLFFEFKA